MTSQWEDEHFQMAHPCKLIDQEYFPAISIRMVLEAKTISGERGMLDEKLLQLIANSPKKLTVRRPRKRPLLVPRDGTVG